MEMKKILITGGIGYIGSVLTKNIIGENLFEEIYIVDKGIFGMEPYISIIESANKELKSRLHLIRRDILDIPILKRIIKKVDVIIHLAAIVGDPMASIVENDCEITNWIGTVSLAKLCSLYGRKIFIFASTCSVYGHSGKKRVDENNKPNPLSSYALSKLKAEEDLIDIGEKTEIVPIILRFSTVYGVSLRMRFDLVANRMAADAFFKGKVTVFGGSQVRPLVHINDINNLIVSILSMEDSSFLKNEIINVGSDEENYRIIDLGSQIAKFFRADLEVRKNITDKRSYRVSFKKIREVLGYRCKYTLRDFLKEIKEKFEEGMYSDYLTNPKYHNYKMALILRTMCEDTFL